MDIHTTPPKETPTEVASPKAIVMSKRNIIIAVAVVLLLAIAGLIYRYKDLLVVANVNGHFVSRAAYMRELQKQNGKAVLDVMVTKQLINDAAKSKGITVSDDEINQEIQKYEKEFAVQGHTLDDTLSAQNLTRADLKEQITFQKKIQKLIGDKAQVSDEEVSKYIQDSKVTLTAGHENEMKSQIKDQLLQQKLSELSAKLLADLHAQAKIKTYIRF